MVMLTEWGRAAGEIFGFGQTDICSVSGLPWKSYPAAVVTQARAWEESQVTEKREGQPMVLAEAWELKGRPCRSMNFLH